MSHLPLRMMLPEAERIGESCLKKFTGWIAFHAHHDTLF